MGIEIEGEAFRKRASHVVVLSRCNRVSGLCPLGTL